MPVNVFFVPLGCAKNLVDSERMIAQLKAAGMRLVEDAGEAEVAIVNTCGFIEPAQREAIEILLELGELKKTGSLRAIVAAGCLTQRYREEFLTELPEVDAVLGTGSYDDIVEAVHGALKGEKIARFADMSAGKLSGERSLLTPQYSAYLRIAEGCDNRCAYCVIPYLRGPFRSRPMEELLDEATELVKSGTRELMVIAQDISRYGTDLYGKRCLDELVSGLCAIEGLHWVRLHYLYPDELDDSLLAVIARNPKVLRYFDIPLQHINDRVLKDMNRRGNGALIRERIEKIRALMPEAVIRTSLIVGFPGESDAEFDELYDFLAEYKLERAGVFCYSREEGSPAYDMPNQVPEEVKESRRAALFTLQQDIMNEKSAALIGRTLEVLCCGVDENGQRYGRSYMDAPDIDGVVYFEEEVPEGTFAMVKIHDAAGCELFGEVISMQAGGNK